MVSPLGNIESQHKNFKFHPHKKLQSLSRYSLQVLIIDRYKINIEDFSVIKYNIQKLIVYNPVKVYHRKVYNETRLQEIRQ